MSVFHLSATIVGAPPPKPLDLSGCTPDPLEPRSTTTIVGAYIDAHGRPVIVEQVTPAVTKLTVGATCGDCPRALDV